MHSPIIRLLKKYPKQTDAILLVLGFVVGMNFMAYMKLAGMQPQAVYADNTEFYGSVPTLVGLVVGGALVVIEYTLFDRLYISLTPRKVLALRLICTITMILLGVVFVAVLSRMWYAQQSLETSFKLAVVFLQTPMALSFLVYMFLLSVLLNFFRQLGNHFGHGLIYNFVTGRYAQVQEEHRTFMFLDLDHSTTLAEQLGHVKYSRLLKKCFNDLSELLPRYDADVYQYVGDEVVLTWATFLLKPHLDLPRLYFDFQDKLKEETWVYKEKFGVIPTFKASMHSGLVSITQIGQHRKELAYHGDVLNTASRVLAQASAWQKKLLVTASLVENVGANADYQLHFVDTILLRGKREQTQVYEVVRKKKAAKLSRKRTDSFS